MVRTIPEASVCARLPATRRRRCHRCPCSYCRDAGVSLGNKNELAGSSRGRHSASSDRCSSADPLDGRAPARQVSCGPLGGWWSRPTGPT